MTELIRLLYASDTFILRVSINLCLYENIIERFFVAVFKHTLKIFAVVVGAGHGAVDISADDDQNRCRRGADLRWIVRFAVRNCISRR